MNASLRMHRCARAIVAACGLIVAVGSACGGGSGGSTFPVFPAAFPQGFLPVTLSAGAGSGDVAFRTEGDLYVVAGSADVTAVSHEDGSVSTFAGDVGGAGTVLLSAVVGSDGRLFVADEDGIVYAIDAEGVATLLVDTGSGPITGLAAVPTGFGDLGGSLLAAAGSAGLLRITTGETPEVSDFAPMDSYVDLAFSGTTLFALDMGSGEVDTIDAEGMPTLFQDGFGTPVGMAVDPTSSELLIASADDATLYAMPVEGGAPEPRALYPYSPTPPSGIAYDGAGALAWVTSGSVVVRGSVVPRVDPEGANFGLGFLGPTVGYGDLELSRDGSFLLVANDPDDPDDPDDGVGNFLFIARRNLSAVTTIAADVGQASEALLSLAYDARSNTIYIGTGSGDVYRRNTEGEVDLLVTASSSAVLGLELAPDTFGAFGGQLVATTSAGEVLAIDPGNPVPMAIVDPPIDTTSGEPAPLSDLVFDLVGNLYVLDNGSSPTPGDPRILIVAPDGSVDDGLMANPGQLGQPDGLEIDEGGERLLVVVSDDPFDQLVEVSLRVGSEGQVTPVADLRNSADDGFFPSGVIYDRLGTAVVREGDAFTSLDAIPLLP